MPDINIARVALDNVAFHFDKAFDYRIPNELLGSVKRGCRVVVPFGRGNTVKQGLVVETCASSPEAQLKPVSAVLDKTPLLNDEMLGLVMWLKEHTFCTMFDAFRAIVPAGINLKTAVTYTASPNADINNAEVTADEHEIFEHLLKLGKYHEKQAILSKLGFSQGSKILENMADKGLLVRNIDASRVVGDLTQKMVRLAGGTDGFEELLENLTAKQRAVADLLGQVGAAAVKEVCYFTGVTPAVVKALVKKGAAEFFDSEIYRSPAADKRYPTDTSEITLTKEQETVFRNVLSRMNSGGADTTLLYGVTGSGKTKVYLRLIDEIVKTDKGAIVMVPEIALTPQILNAFRARYGSTVAVFHSALSLGERLDEWKRVKRGEAKIVVGTRSAVFAPVENIGIIIVDEEQEHTYKSEMTPRYDAREVARFRCSQHRAALLLGSATPGVENFARALKKKIHLEILDERYGNAQLPQVTVVDIGDALEMQGRSALSRELVCALQENIQHGRQSILLMNRRGYNTFVSCRACSHVVTCPNCSISMTYHHANGRLMCHYCGYSVGFTETCPQCGKKDVRYSGFGTQRVEEELASLLPGARILRMDMDTTMAKFAHEKKLDAFAAGDYDILLGTQMVAKGLDFENVTLVGVVSADQQLYNDDFRSMERTFSLLTQVVGRSGRGKNSGRAIIQTVTPENELIRLAAAQDYRSFFDSEIMVRKLMTYPPFCDLCVVGFVGANPNRVRVCAKYFLDNLRRLTEEKYGGQKLIVLGPMMPRVGKISNKYRYRLIIKCKNSAQFRKMMAELLTVYASDSRTNDVTAFADINPESIM